MKTSQKSDQDSGKNREKIPHALRKLLRGKVIGPGQSLLEHDDQVGIAVGTWEAKEGGDQSRFDVTVVIYGYKGYPLETENIPVLLKGNNATLHSRTNRRGDARFSGIPVGEYAIEVPEVLLPVVLLTEELFSGGEQEFYFNEEKIGLKIAVDQTGKLVVGAQTQDKDLAELEVCFSIINTAQTATYTNEEFSLKYSGAQWEGEKECSTIPAKAEDNRQLELLLWVAPGAQEAS